MKFCFRADASLYIGSGHVIRCLTIADALAQHGHESYFICRPHQGNLIEFVKQRGYMVHALSEPLFNTSSELSEYQRWLGVTEQQDAQETLAVLTEYPVDWMIVDHYGLSAIWQQIIRPEVSHIVAIDDLANRKHDADIILDCGLANTPSDYAKLNQRVGHYLMGPRYALLRSEFRTKRLWLEQHPKTYNQEKLRILVNLGGIDKDNLTGTVLETLSNSPQQQRLSVTVVMGVNAPWKESVLQQAKKLPFSINILINANNMADLMAEHDLAIGAAGSTAWERCCLGLPTIMICMADNQKMIAKYLHDLGVAISLDQAEIHEKLLWALQQFDQEQLQLMHQKALSITDGIGVDLLLQTIFSEEFKEC
ncbi:UDP-2,4-diacetamido-2,4,6-trideoxy-beta-L-altropyranose hydrolase [Acinetobacter baumannii]|uniref:UDP-2,4-diacetamido-2,4, 6-trideoxy-beta-L-altropyranose hydrolase n=1 Tax=Acinetobacter baumannii TaxID=470 RepID=UPI000A3902AF|nr:UDP-2,4-diacetamido-2,4,6-trideoxy-beta-L-altropyranose hydrolase [Acinetobacter baumannii]OTT31974.1 UDP-2,4-diacetamido-2,4,6-trideoxy-beta-L-altropyranose hydrolase [Acinetobacter baumannii]TPS11610.1 UDP-2,4-diacetamido-2,4,6-trideoxy-beta-L-altropyranose hydrolase [Acinetobacter baumannii]HDI2993750.1 UDP-2,4-diacetamido-2,4,6-trideoxy-beta-L-altropyranose hydrolase [Acinetobacter baumannii]HDI5573305.1 UDP-2,4-diacetamido-2,4,6-trideoxy-beta-L-altropyranose hydrolase [Acinetobacter bau